MALIVMTIVLLSQAAAPPPRPCPANLLELTERIGELRADYPELAGFVASDAFKPMSPANTWPSISFERGVSRVPVPPTGHPPGRARRTDLSMRGRDPILLEVGFIAPVEIDQIATIPDGLVLGWYYRVSVKTRDKIRRMMIYGSVVGTIRSYEGCPQPKRPLNEAGH